MNEQRAQELIVGCMATAAVIGVGSSLAQGEGISGRMVFGFGFATLGLAAGAMFSPGLAGSFAVLVLTSAAFIYGQPLYDAVTTQTTGTTAGPTTTTTTTGATPGKVYV
jgi:hypothetical protein